MPDLLMHVNINKETESIIYSTYTGPEQALW